MAGQKIRKSNYSIPKVNPKYKMNLRMRKENKWQTAQQRIVFIQRIDYLTLFDLFKVKLLNCDHLPLSWLALLRLD